MDFDKYLKMQRRIHGGETIQKVYRFPNGYGASVVQGPYSYGGSAGKWEIAMTIWIGDDWTLTYDNDEFADVIGYLDDNKVDKYLQYIFDKEAANA